MNQSDNSPKGLPRHFMVIGIGLILLPLVFMAITKLMYDDVSSKFGERNIEIIEAFSGTCIILGLLMINLTRSKVETEAIKNARITGLVGGFMTGVVMVLLTPQVFGKKAIEKQQ